MRLTKKTFKMEKSNPNLVRDGEVEFDKRMTPETKASVLEYQKTLGSLDFSSIPFEAFRHGRDKQEKELIESLKFDNLDKPTEIFIKNPVDGYEIPASVFKPTDPKKDAPIVVFFHGDGWMTGSRQSHYHPVASLASKTKSVWISIEYRLAPEFKYKTQVTDYKAALEWISNNREQFSTKEAKIGVVGDSAGGQIAALLSHYYKPILSFQNLVYPAVDSAGHYNSNDEFKANCYFLTPQLIKTCIKNYLEDPEMAKSPDVSPILMKDFTNLPKALIIAAELDPLIDSNKAYHERILDAKRDTQFKLIKGNIHGFFHNSALKDSFYEFINYIADFMKNV